ACRRGDMTQSAASLRVAVVGCGRMGTERASRASSLGSAVVACVDADVERARALAATCGCPVIATDPKELDWSGIDAVFVCTPPSARNAAVLRAIEARAAVMVEKPIGLSAEDGSIVAEAAGRAGVINAVGYMNRYRG